MTMLNGILAFGAAAFAIPLIIHILNRSRFRTIEWGAMHLLDSIVRVNHKRFRIEQLILLLVRCAIPAVLAFCLARPVLTGWRDLAGNAPVSAVILLDTSYSMDASGPQGKHFDLAVEQAVAVLKAMSRGSEVAVIQTGGRPTSIFGQPIFDPSLMIEQLRQLKGGFGASQMPEALDLALVTLAGMSHVRRELIVISDFQVADWPADAAFANQIRKQVEDAHIAPALTLLRVGETTPGNVSVEGLEFSRRAIGVGQQLLVRANLKNHGTETYEKARVTLLCDGVEQSVSQVDLEPQSTTQTLFECRFETAGSHVLTVELTVDDPLSTDNRYSAAVNVWDKIEVLLVDGQPSSEPLQGETDFLAVALTPFTLGRLKLADLLQTKTISPAALNSDLLKATRVVVLANVAKLADEQVDRLMEYVRAGGALLVFPGDRLDADWYNKHLFAERGGILPLPFFTAIGTHQDDGKGTRIVSQHFDHPALELFNVPTNGDLSTATIRRWYRLGEPNTTAPSLLSLSPTSFQPPQVPNQEPSKEDSRPLAAEVIVMARLETGDPFLVQKQVGDGIVVQMATSCDADWSDLPLRPIYLPLMQQLVTSLASQVAPSQNIVTGEPIVAVFRGEHKEATLSLASPDGSRLTVRPQVHDGRSVARYLDTQRPGVYTLIGPDAEPIHYVAESSRSESDLTLLDDSTWDKLAETMAADNVKSASVYLQHDKLRRHGREIWKILLVALLALMFLEVVLQQTFARARV
jgi:hypothetical protein